MNKLISLNNFTCYIGRMNFKNLMNRLRDEILKNIIENLSHTLMEEGQRK